MDELKYTNGSFTINGTDINDIIADVSNNTEQFSVVDNLEYLDVLLDSDDKIIEAVDVDGVVLHNTTDKFNTIVLSDDTSISSLSDLETALKADSFISSIGDYSDDEFVELPLPRVCAKVNIICDTLPTTKTADYTATMEYFDKDGNYFKKPIEAFSAQGDTSMVFNWKNFGFDIADGSKIKFGTWVPQDSFHLKKYYIDTFRGQCVVAYHLAEQMYQEHGEGNKRPYDKLHINDSTLTSNGVFEEDFDTGALTHPDGFPFQLYHNGTLVGLYCFCLKKHRDNYAMDKGTAEHILLDGALSASTIWVGTIDWTQFEIRNPKNLYYKEAQSGTYEYDADVAQAEIANRDTVDTWITVGQLPDGTAITSKIQKNLEMTAKVHTYITNLSNRISEVNSASTTDEKKTLFETYFNLTFLMDYVSFGQVTADFDGFGKNWLWCTWDGEQWCPTIYDKDSIFGSSAQGSAVHEYLLTTILGSSTALPSGLMLSLYADEFKAYYKKFRDNGIFTVDNIIDLLNDWLKRVGYDNLKTEFEESCPETPSYRDPYLNDGWEIIGNASSSTVSTYDSTVTYATGDTCDYCNPDTTFQKWGLKFRATKEVTGVAPLSAFYSNFPTEGGYYNSVQRVKNWLTSRLEFLDSVYYN